MGDPYAFDGLPVEPIRAGTVLLVSGPMHAGARDLALQLLSGTADEGVVIITTNRRAERIADDCARVGIELAADRAAILDCVGEEASNVPARVLSVSGPADLTGIGMCFSDVYRDYNSSGIERVRTGLFSLSTLLSFGDLKSVSRFAHTLGGRIDSVDGFGVLLIDPVIHDDRTISTLSQFCDARIDVRDTDATPELRVRGLPDQPREWTPFEPTSD
ncbi:DUF7504 family protein [Halostella salina]|uniref:DUF7504 family protein n=1 Tax=Halostella salina TaxID=1547897 RepID=UPI000EF7D37A|nr:hypothetical protein [Halostella salina]